MADARTLVIGIGNGLLGDDDAGPAVAAAVRHILPAVRTLVVHQLLPELADAVATAERVVFVDASVGVTEVAVTEVQPGERTGETHVSSPAALLALCRDAYAAVPRQSWLVEVPASRFGLGVVPSDATRRGVDVAVARIVGLLGISTP